MPEKKHSFRVLTVPEAMTALRQARQVHTGKRSLPPEILEIRKRIKEAERNATLFMIRMRVVDEGMIDYALALRFELDRLYGEWARSETPAEAIAFATRRGEARL